MEGDTGAHGPRVISPAEVARIADLARLRLTEDELERFTPQLNQILAHFAELTGVADAAAAVGVLGEAMAPLAPDEPGADPLLAGPETFAPGFEQGFFTLPRLSALDSGPGSSPNREDTP